MGKSQLEKAKETFNLQAIAESINKSIRLREEFVAYFSPRKLASLTIEEYVIGRQNKESFCYILERTLYTLGSISGPPSSKFGVWYSPSKKQYCFEKRFGDNYLVAFEMVKRALLQLLKDGQNKDYDAIRNNPINSLVKGKILAMYFPDMYMNVYSVNHLNHYLTFFGLENKALMLSDAIYKREALMKFKNDDDVMKEWSNYVFSVFLWSHYPTDQRIGG